MPLIGVVIGGLSLFPSTLDCAAAIRIHKSIYAQRRPDRVKEQIVSLANGRCDQENGIEQLKNGANAMRMPVNDLGSNGAYMF